MQIGRARRTSFDARLPSLAPAETDRSKPCTGSPGYFSLGSGDLSASQMLRKIEMGLGPTENKARASKPALRPDFGLVGLAVLPPDNGLNLAAGKGIKPSLNKTKCDVLILDHETKTPS